MSWHLSIAVLLLLLEAGTWYFVARYNIHMFQQNMYLANEQLAWLRGNWLKQDVLIVCLLTAVISAATNFALPAVLFQLLLLLLALYYYRFLKRYHAKKPLVFTARVRRLMACDALVTGAVVGSIAAAYGLSASVAALALLSTLQPVALLLANAINTPIEHAINARYLGEAKRLLATHPQLTIVGITGSFGKTSVKYYLHTLLQESFNVLITPGNYNTPLGITRTIRESLRPTHELFICEMGARYVGEIAEICDLVHPDHGVITAVGPQHLETFGSLENVEATKFELAEALPAEGKLFLNIDNERIDARASRYPQAISYAVSNTGAAYRATDITLTSTGTTFTLVAPNGEHERFTVRLVGTHAIVNVVGALAVAHELGIELSQLTAPARRIRAVNHRMEMSNIGWATLIDDAYNSNPVGARAAVETLAQFSGMRILITPGMVELGNEQARYNRAFGEQAAPCCDYALVVGKENREALCEGLRAAGFAEARLRTFSHVEDAIDFARSIDTEEHKVVLLENDLPDIY